MYSRIAQRWGGGIARNEMGGIPIYHSLTTLTCGNNNGWTSKRTRGAQTQVKPRPNERVTNTYRSTNKGGTLNQPTADGRTDGRREGGRGAATSTTRRAETKLELAGIQTPPPCVSPSLRPSACLVAWHRKRRLVSFEALRSKERTIKGREGGREAAMSLGLDAPATLSVGGRTRYVTSQSPRDRAHHRRLPLSLLRCPPSLFFLVVSIPCPVPKPTSVSGRGNGCCAGWLPAWHRWHEDKTNCA